MHDSKLYHYCTKAIFSLFMLLIIFIHQGCSHNRQIPFIEAGGYVDTMSGDAVVRWLSADKIIYGVNSTNKKNSYSQVNYMYLESSKQINIFDIKNQKTYLYKRGQLLEYVNGKILIRLSVGGYDHINNIETSRPKYLYGYMGSETQEKYELATEKLSRNLQPLDKCPSDKTNTKPYLAWLLGPEHPNACLRLPDLYDKDRRWIYYPAKGKALELTTSKEMLIPKFTWISWMQAYLLDNRSISATTTTMKILYTDGNFQLIDIGQVVSHAKPTKVGIIGAINNNWLTNGLRLFHDGSVYQITTGRVSLTEVSPDGCKVAYVTNDRLRVINLCAFFGADKI